MSPIYTEPVYLGRMSDPPTWFVKVTRSGKTYRTVFTVEQQSFTLARSDDPDEAKVHCEFIGAMFCAALAKLGLKPAKGMGVKAPKRRVSE
jgi:hypothetical protein